MDVRHYATFADLIRAIRRHHRLSQRALARALRVSAGYVGQWELRISQPSNEVTAKLCRLFSIDDIEYVQRLAYASRAPEWLRESILHDPGNVDDTTPPSPVERRILAAVRQLPDDLHERLAEKVEGWVEGMLERE